MNEPLYVDWLKGPGPGAVGLTIAPGKYVHGVWDRDLDADLRQLRQVERTDVLACLLESHELRTLDIEELVPRARALGLVVLRLPIRDGGLPESAEALAKLLGRIARHVDAGRRVVVHCAGGLGRSGLVAGCYLRERGVGPVATLRRLREARGPRCPETRAQTEYVRAWPNVS